MLAEAARLGVLGPELGLLVPGEHGEERRLHAAGPGGDQDPRYGAAGRSERAAAGGQSGHCQRFVPTGDQSGECRAHGNLGSALFSKGSYREALANHRNQLVLAMKLKDREVCLHLRFDYTSRDMVCASQTMIGNVLDLGLLSVKVLLGPYNATFTQSISHNTVVPIKSNGKIQTPAYFAKSRCWFRLVIPPPSQMSCSCNRDSGGGGARKSNINAAH